MGNSGGPQSRGDTLELVAEFDRQISRLSFSEIVKGALGFVSERLSLARASVALLLPDRDGFRLFDATVDILGIESGRTIPLSSASLGETVRQRRPVYRTDIRLLESPNAVDLALAGSGICSTYSIPLEVGGRCIGTLNCASGDVDGISELNRLLLTLVAPRLAFALEMAQAIDAAAESEARFRDVFNTVGDGIVVADTSNRGILLVNAAMSVMLGRSREELVNSRVSILHPADTLEETVKVFSAMLDGKLEHALDIPVVRADGSVFYVDVTARRTVIQGKPCAVAVFRDATTRSSQQAEQLHLQKLESIRTLAAGIAHDFNNLLTGLIGNMSLAQELVANEPEVSELLEQAQGAATRAASLTKQLLTFAKGGAPVRGRANVVQILKHVAKGVTAACGVTVQWQLPQGEPLVLGDEGQLSQVFGNLLQNAVESMPEGGTLYASVSLLEDQSRANVCVEIRDEGKGIPIEQIGKVFLPFFSTKQSRSGLGLAVAFSVVQNHGGRIWVESSVGQGSTFRVYLPRLLETSESVAPPLHSSAGATRVLLMDDESIILQIAERALKRAGFAPTTTVNGEQAVAAYRDALHQGHRFAAVLLDLTVKDGMGGREAAMRILALDRQARLIVSSGYSDDAIMSDYRPHGFCAVLPKPYSAAQLCETVSTALTDGIVVSQRQPQLLT